MMSRSPGRDAALLETPRAFDAIKRAVDARQPFSFIRIGDGEGLLLSLDEDSWIQDLQYLVSHFGATGVSYGRLLRLRDELHRAVACADLLGLRDDVVGTALDPSLLGLAPETLAQAVKERFPLRPMDRNLPAPGCRRLALLSRYLSTVELDPPAGFASAWAHWDLAASGLLYRLLKRERHIGLITCHTALPALVEEIFGLRTRAYEVPDKLVNAPAGESAAHYPRRFESLREELRIDFPGMVFLVGAGICGKIYCQWIKERGGIALDIGSVMDAWMGLATRPAVMVEKFGAAPEDKRAPADLRLERATVERLLARAHSEP